MLRYLNYHGYSLFSPVPKRYTNQPITVLLLVLNIYSQLETFPEVSDRLPVTLNLNDVLNHVLLLIMHVSKICLNLVPSCKVNFLQILPYRKPSAITQNFGATMKHLMLQEDKLYVTHRRPN